MGLDFGSFAGIGQYSMQRVDNLIDANEEQHRASDAAGRAQDFSAQQAQLDRDFQAQMSNTAYQRAVGDMKKAGLNPALAYEKGGASTPAGASAVGVNAGAPRVRGVDSGPFVTAAQVRNIEASTNKTNAEADEVRARTPTYGFQIDKLQQDVAESRQRVQSLMAEAKHSYASAGEAEQRTANLRESIPQIQAATRQLRALATLNDQQIGEVAARTGRERAEIVRLQQETAANMPELERALGEIEKYGRQLDLPRREQDAAANDRFVGSLGAVMRILNPFQSFMPGVSFGGPRTVIQRGR